jgi:hypothetical protein
MKSFKTTPKFEIGQVVKLKGLEKKLVIERWRYTLHDPTLIYYLCVYLDNEGCIKQAEINEQVLEKVCEKD